MIVRSRIAALLVVTAGVLALAAGIARFGPGEPGALPSASVRATASPTGSPTPSATPPPVASAAPITLVGAGDIGVCGAGATAATAALVERIGGAVFTAGDNAYDEGTATEFARCFAPTWGTFKDRIRPAPGNHDYGVPGASGYFDYFGAAAGERGKGYYSYDLGAWHVVVLNSVCAAVGGCGPSSPQVLWLRNDLATHAARCTLAIWHHPRFSSGAEHGSDPTYQTFWNVLYEFGADVVVNGHDHDYERFAPQTPDAAAPGVKGNGIREFVVGTGGPGLYAIRAPIANSEVLRNDTHGVLELTLRPAGYDWNFVQVDGATFTDSGSDSCH